MKWKLTVRYLISVVFVVLFIIFVNLFLMLALFMAQSVLNIPIFQEEEHSPELFTRQFQDQITISGDAPTIADPGKEELSSRNAWIQILDETGKELFRYKAPEGLKKSYTPSEIVQMYKYKEVNGETTVFVGEKKAGGRAYSYLIGMENRNINRYVILYDNQSLFRMVQVGGIVLVIDILITLLIGYFLSQRLTKPLYTLIDGIKRLANHEYFHARPTGVFKQVFLNINQLSNHLKANESERKKLDRMKEEWVTNISHDIKTPLASIQGFAEMMKDPDYRFTEDEIREYADIIEKKSLYIKEVIEDLSLTTRLKNKELTLNKKTTNLVVLLRNIVIDIVNDPKYARRHIEFHANQENIPAEVDEILVRRAIHNLIYNALIHNDANVNIAVRIEKTDRTRIVVQDNGKGIRKEELDKIFDRYYRGTNTGDAHKGSGLGMAIAKDIIQEHDGEIKIRSEVGRGTTIEIQL
ncbi:Signal transduction histidine kinase [Paenibacillus tianmuensis]|uniref:histidine kinase n=1 Tax=Paenibacillus tianmuensis TaxID=624147 RepID=A0A1G4SE56_9BACL|nr:HAMP domain-containing sensor histidine kinase [Paenibacillus tianmuensis]SCW67494.1 Signal transduction histidine kinase [Paenibacillus tianmuensis]